MKVEFITDSSSKVPGVASEAHGSDNRLNVSSRSNSRSFYISRDSGQEYGVSSHDATSAAGTYIIYLQNTSPTKKLYVDRIIAGGVASVLWKVWFVTGTSAGGNLLTPTNFNHASSNAAETNARGDDAITGLSTAGQIVSFRSASNDRDDEEFGDTIILGQNDAIAVEADAVTSTAIAECSIIFSLE